MRRGVLLLAVPLGLLLLGAVALANVYDYAGPYLPLAKDATQASAFQARTAAGWGIYRSERSGVVVYLRRSKLSAVLHGGA